MSHEVSIEVMNKSHINEALKLWKQSFNRGFSEGFDTYEVIENYLKRNPNFSTVAYVDDKLVGALMCGHDGRRGSIYHTAVYPEYRGLGIGKKMEERSINQLRKIGVTTGFLFINVNNPGSKEFWESIGWQVISDIRYLYKEF